MLSTQTCVSYFVLLGTISEGSRTSWYFQGSPSPPIYLSQPLNSWQNGSTPVEVVFRPVPRDQSTSLINRVVNRLSYFPSGSYIMLDLEIAFPLVVIGDFSNTFFTSLSFNYLLPSSTSTPRQLSSSLDLDRQVTYQAIESFLSIFGVDGHTCLLKTICQLADSPLDFQSEKEGALMAVIGRIMAASYRWQDDAMYEYAEAEYFGRYYGNCEEAYPCEFNWSI